MSQSEVRFAEGDEARAATPEERRLVLEQWSGSEGRSLPTQTVPALFAAQARRSPEAAAVLHAEGALSYGALEARSDRLARALVRHGVRRGDCVGICLSPSLDLIVSLLGVLKAGAAYLPVDPQAPHERVDFCFDAAAVKVVVTQPGHVALVARQQRRQAVVLEEGWYERLPSGEEVALPQLSLEDAAYVIFTSGSTGEPKGVLVPHRGLANHATAMSRRFGLQPSDRLLQFTPIHFDAAGEEIYPPLLVGAATFIKEDLVAARDFSALVTRDQISVLSLPPAFLNEWIVELERGERRLPSCLRLVILGGEKLVPEMWRRWLALEGQTVPWLNVYGPTEATITAALCEISPSGFDLSAPVLPIGRPIDNVQVYVLDDSMEPVPPGRAGELFIGGAGLAYGYLGRTALTAERFVPHPFSSAGGERLYRTGDVVRFLAGGALEFLGRVDHQIKLRGFRVEPGEIESHLRQLPGVDDALVTAAGDSPAKMRLVAYVLSVGSTAPAPSVMRETLAGALPAYMVPADYVVLPRWPLSPNGKVDRKALPLPSEPVTANEVPAGTETETRLRIIWEEVLGCPIPSLQADFFELGGHSLAAMQIVARVSEELGADLELMQVFELPTVAQLAEAIEERRTAVP